MFESRGHFISRWSMIVRVNVVLNRNVVVVDPPIVTVKQSFIVSLLFTVIVFINKL